MGTTELFSFSSLGSIYLAIRYLLFGGTPHHGESSRLVLKNWLEKIQTLGVLSSYQWALAGLNRRMNSVLGSVTPVKEWYKAYSVCLTIAFFYPLFFLFIGYVSGESHHELGGVEFFPNYGSNGRFLVGLGVVCYLVLVFFIAKYGFGIQARIKIRSTALLWVVQCLLVLALCAALYAWDTVNAATNVPMLIILLPIIFTVVFGFTGAVALTLAVPFFFYFNATGFAFALVLVAFSGIVFILASEIFSLDGITAILGGKAFSVTTEFALGVIISVVVVVASTTGGVLSLVGTEVFNDQGLIIILFLMILPLVNSFFDLLSLQISRYFIQRIAKVSPKRVFLIARELFLDMVIAVILLVALVFVLMIAIQFANVYIIQNIENHIDLYDHVKVVVADPWGKGLMTTMMLLSTLVPTAIHVFIGILAIALSTLRIAPYLQQKIVSYDKALVINDPRFDQNASAFHQASIVVLCMLALSIVFIVLAVFTAVLYWLMTCLPDAAIGELALKITSWVILLF